MRVIAMKFFFKTFLHSFAWSFLPLLALMEFLKGFSPSPFCFYLKQLVTFKWLYLIPFQVEFHLYNRYREMEFRFGLEEKYLHC